MSVVPAIREARVKRTDVVALLAHASNVYGRARAIEPDEAEAWYRALGDHTHDQCARAFQAHYEDTVRGVRFPTIADVLYHVKRLAIESTRDDWRKQFAVASTVDGNERPGWFRALCEAAVAMRKEYGVKFVDRPDCDEEMERRAHALIAARRGRS